MASEFVARGHTFKVNLSWDAPVSGTIPGSLWIKKRAKSKKAKGIVTINNTFAGFCEDTGKHVLLASVVRHLALMETQDRVNPAQSIIVVIQEDVSGKSSNVSDETEPRFIIFTLIEGRILAGNLSETLRLGIERCAETIFELSGEKDFDQILIDDSAIYLKALLREKYSGLASLVRDVSFDEINPENSDLLRNPNTGSNISKYLLFGGASAALLFVGYIGFGTWISHFFAPSRPKVTIAKTAETAQAIAVSEFLASCKRIKTNNNYALVGWHLKSVGCYRSVEDKRLGKTTPVGKPGMVAEYILDSDNPGLARDLARKSLASALQETGASYIIFDTSILLVVPLDVHTTEVTRFVSLDKWRINLDRNLVGIAENYNLALQRQSVTFKSSYPVDDIAQRLANVPGTDILQAVFIDQQWTIEANMLAPTKHNDLRSRLAR